MTLDEAIKRVGRYWHTGMDDYFTFDEILELEEMLKELKGYRERATDTNVGGKED